MSFSFRVKSTHWPRNNPEWSKLRHPTKVLKVQKQAKNLEGSQAKNKTGVYDEMKKIRLISDFSRGSTAQNK